MLAVLQLRATADVTTNLARAITLIRRAAGPEFQAQFICLPEAFDYIVDAKAPEGSAKPKPEPLDGDRVRLFTKLAKDLNVWLSLGGIHEARSDGRQHNSHVVINSKGFIEDVYRKIHLFDAKVENGFHESATVVPGDRIVVIKDTPVGNVGLSTCYDVRFPSMYMAMRDAGADVILVPSAFTMVTGKAHWHTLLRARAIENQVYIAAAAQVGPHNSSRSSFGHSLVVDPFGLVMADLGVDEDVIATCEISKKRLQEVRMQMPQQEHRHNANGVLTISLSPKT